MPRYPRPMIYLHWLLTVLILMSLIGGKVLLESTPNSDPGKVSLLGGHMVLGMVILVLMLVRVGLRLRGPLPPDANADQPLLSLAGKAGHGGLYLLIFGMCLSGLALSVAAGLPGNVFGNSGEPLPADFHAFTARAAHGLMASLLILLVAVHVAAALWHQFGRKDGLMNRMRLR
jgi:cytochrome b561